MILDRFNIDGQVAVITGAGRGIGAGSAVALAEAGAIHNAAAVSTATSHERAALNVAGPITSPPP